MDYGIDISSWNPVRDWAAVRGNNISFVSVKTTQGDRYVNPRATAQLDGARAVGIAAGAYHFADSNISVQRNVDFFVRESRARGAFERGSFLPMLDLEDSAGDRIFWNAGSANSFVADFIRRLRDATGVAQVAVYASLSVWQNTLRANDWADDQVYLWIALYNGDPTNLRGWNHRRAALHQHTDKGNVSGIDGHVDRNVTLNGFRLTSMTIGNVAPPAPPAPSAPAPAPSPTPGGWVDYQVRAGDTLSGIASARSTTVAELARVNGIADPNRIYAGQVIRVPAAAGAPQTRTYTVKSGDTLSQIAARLGVQMSHLVGVNNISNPNLIFPGQVLRY